MKKLLILLLFSATSLLLGFVYSFHYPRLKTWLLSEIYIYTYENTPVIIDAQNFEFNLFPLGVQLNNVQIKIQEDNFVLHDSYLKGIRAYINPFQFLLGHLAVSEIAIIGGEIKLNLKSIQDTKQSDTKSIISIPKLESILDFPIDSFLFEKVKISGNFSEHYFSYNFDDFVIRNLKSSISLFGKSNIQYQHKQETLNFDIFLDTSLTNKKLSLKNLELNVNSTEIIISSLIDLNLQNLNIKKMRSNNRIRIKTNLEQLYIPKSITNQIPKLKGQGVIDAEFEAKGAELVNAKLNTQFQSFDVGGYYVGDLIAAVKIKDKNIDAANFSFANGPINFSIADIQLKKDFSWNANINITSFELKHFLNSIKVNDVPLHLEADGHLPCTGIFKPSFEIRCNGKITAKNFSIHTGAPKNFLIHELDKAIVDGNVVVNSKGVYTEADIHIGSTTGRAKGHTEYLTGFHYEFETDNLDFVNIKSFANLKLEGQTKVKGSTYGDSDKGIIDLKLSTKDLWLEDYKIGQLTGQFLYKNGFIVFPEAKIKNKASRSTVNLSIDLNKSRISGKFNSPFLTINELQDIFSRKLQLPIHLKGTGSAKASFSGPLQFNQLNYNLQSNFRNLLVGKETLDRLQLNISAKNGKINADNIKFSKAKATGYLTGSVNSNYQANLKVIGKSFLLENSEYITSLFPGLSGVVNFQFDIKEKLNDPDLKLKTHITNFTIANESYPSSTLDLNFSKKDIQAKANFFEGKVKADAVMPYNKKDPFKLKLIATNWNFAPLFSIVNKNTVKDGFSANLNANIDIAANSGGFWNSTGNIDISNASLNRGNIAIKSTNPLNIKLKSGNFSIKDYSLEGDGSILKLNAKNFNADNVNLSLNGKLDLAFLSFLTPFFEDLRGELSLSTQLTGNSKKIDLLGSAFFKNSYVKIQDFPHPFENIKGDLLFSQNKIIVNSLSANLASGNMNANGELKILAFDKAPLKLTGKLENANLEVVDGISLNTNAEFEVSGDWFPYKLSGIFDIPKGNIGELKTSNEKSSTFNDAFPKLIVSEAFDPLEFDITAIVHEGVIAKNTFADTKVNGKIKITGPSSKPQLIGDIHTLKGGKIFFRETPFIINSGSVNFKGRSDINPELYINAETTITDQYEERTSYEIDMQITGNIKKPNIKLVSQPNLPETDIISLLVLGVTKDQLEAQDFSQQRNQQAWELGKVLINNAPPLKEIEKKTGLKVDFSQQVDEDNETSIQGGVSYQWTPKFSTSAKRVFNNSAKTDINAEYKLKTNLSVIGSYQTQEPTEGESQKNSQDDIFGLDLQYKMEFK